MAKETETKVKTVLVFNAELQKETEHTVDIDANGEIVLTCVKTGRFVKLPKGTTAAQVKDYVAAHKASNAGQVTQESIEAQKSELMAALTEEPEDE